MFDQQHPHPPLLFPQQQKIKIKIMIIQMQSQPPKPHPHPQPLFSGISSPSFQSILCTFFCLFKQHQQHGLLLHPHPHPQLPLFPQLQKSSKNRIMNQRISLLQQFPILRYLLSIKFSFFSFSLSYAIYYSKTKKVLQIKK